VINKADLGGSELKPLNQELFRHGCKRPLIVPTSARKARASTNSEDTFQNRDQEKGKIAEKNLP